MSARRLTLTTLLLTVLAGLLLPTAVRAETDVDRAVDAWSSAGPSVYLASGAAGQPLRAGDVRRLDAQLAGLSTPVFVAALADSSPKLAQAHLHELIDRFNKSGTYVVVGDGGFLASSDVPGIEGQTEDLAREATGAHPDDPVAAVGEFVELVDAAASSASGDDTAGTGSDNGGDGGSPWIAALVLGGIALLVVVILRRGRGRSGRLDQAAFADVHRAADEDVTVLGEELKALPVPPAAVPGATEDYQAALDGYERAKDTLGRARRPEDVGAVTRQLEEARWRLACVRARVGGDPVPDRRPPCFFNPRHGPSTQDVSWGPTGGEPRTIPVCAADAERVSRGDEPDARLVSAGGTTVPYWRGPAYFGPYAGGFFGGWGGGAFLGGLLLGEMLTAPMAYGDGGYDAGYDAGSDDAGDPGDFAGGFDDPAGGGGWSDFGGDSGDFGGGDW